MEGLLLQFPQITGGNIGLTVLAPNQDNVVQDGRGYQDIYGTLQCTQIGASGTLTIYVQSSGDGGVTWRDMAAITVTTAVNQFFQVSARTAGGGTPLAASDGALTNNTVVQGPFGARFRLKYTITGVVSSSFICNVSLYLKG